jgi:uncharacterized membrane protein YphA (DoxX/SURF4 family)
MTMNERDREEHGFEADILIKGLRYSLGATAFVAGLDKFFNLLTDWEEYLSPAAKEKLPISDRNFMKIVGVIEMAAGAGLLAGWDRSMGYTIAAWLLGISGNLLTAGYYDIAVRDTNMAVEALVLARLAAMKKKSQAAETRPRESWPESVADPEKLSAYEILASSDITRVA